MFAVVRPRPAHVCVLSFYIFVARFLAFLFGLGPPSGGELSLIFLAFPAFLVLLPFVLFCVRCVVLFQHSEKILKHQHVSPLAFLALFVEGPGLDFYSIFFIYYFFVLVLREWGGNENEIATIFRTLTSNIRIKFAVVCCSWVQ